MSKSKEELEKRLGTLERSALQGDAKVAARLKSDGKLTARERVDKLLDAGSFIEEFMLAETQCTDFGMADKKLPSDGVITGSGEIDGRPVYVFAQDRSILAGTVGSAHAEKVAYVIQTARKLGVPLIGLYDSVGARIQEGLSVTTAIGKIFFENSISSGVVPQISAIMGPCIGVAADSPARTDVIIRVQEWGQMLITGPPVIKEVLGVDDGDFLELKPKCARNLGIGLGRLDGYPVGFVANQPMFLAGSLDVDASDKGSRFIRFCDAFNIPIVTLMDVPGFFPGRQQEEK